MIDNRKGMPEKEHKLSIESQRNFSSKGFIFFFTTFCFPQKLTKSGSISFITFIRFHFFITDGRKLHLHIALCKEVLRKCLFQRFSKPRIFLNYFLPVFSLLLKFTPIGLWLECLRSYFYLSVMN